MFFFYTKRLKDEKSNISNETSVKQNNLHQHQHQQQQNYLHENQTNHFIKWIQQDGFLYITLNVEEIYLHVKLGYCARYRSTSRSFVNEIIKFFTQEFHVHSFVHDFHLAAINRNFSSSITGSQISQTSQTIAKFLDEFVEFFRRIPSYSINKVFKRVYEKSDHSLIPHQFRLIFDFVIDSITKINAEDDENQLLFKTLYVFDNNIAIYSLTDGSSKASNGANNASSDYLKYLVIKIENHSITTASSSWSTSSNQSYMPSSASLASKKLAQSSVKGLDAKLTPNSTKLSNSASYSSLLTPSVPQSSNSETLSVLENTNVASVKQEPLIRILSYYLCINKNQQHQHQIQPSELGNAKKAYQLI